MTQDDIDVLQDFFDSAWEAFVEEELPQSVDDAGDCLYNHPTIHNHGCTIGCYKPGWKGRLVCSFVKYDPDFESLSEYFLGTVDASPALVSSLQLLQVCHDQSQPRSLLYNIENFLAAFADRYDLEIPHETWQYA